MSLTLKFFTMILSHKFFSDFSLPQKLKEDFFSTTLEAIFVLSLKFGFS